MYPTLGPPVVVEITMLIISISSVSEVQMVSNILLFDHVMLKYVSYISFCVFEWWNTTEHFLKNVFIIMTLQAVCYQSSIYKWICFFKEGKIY